MKLVSWTFALALTSALVKGQITYEPGYIISNDGQRTECEIRFTDKGDNPSSLTYRIGDGAPIEATIEGVSEFGITGDATFRRFTVNMDRSSDVMTFLSKEPGPEFKSETLFLRLLVSGKATLYEFVEHNLKRYFYTLDQGVPQQLVYKRYMKRNKEGGWETGYAGTNAQFKQQIFNDLKCPSIGEKDLKKLKYERTPLVKIFSRYNECAGKAAK